MFNEYPSFPCWTQEDQRVTLSTYLAADGNLDPEAGSGVILKDFFFNGSISCIHGAYFHGALEHAIHISTHLSIRFHGHVWWPRRVFDSWESRKKMISWTLATYSPVRSWVWMYRHLSPLVFRWLLSASLGPWMSWIQQDQNAGVGNKLSYWTLVEFQSSVKQDIASTRFFSLKHQF